MANAPIREPDFDAAAFDIRHVIDVGLQAKVATRAPRTSDRWNAGSLGYCLRRQFYERAGVPKPTDFLSSRTLWVGDALHEAVQRMMTWSGLVIGSEVHVIDEELHTSGYVDLIWGGEVPGGVNEEETDYSPTWQAFLEEYRMQLRMAYITDPAVAKEPTPWFPVTGTEFKTSAQYSAEKMYGEGPSFHHLIQAADYALIARRNPDQLPDFLKRHPIERWQLTILAKSDMKMLVFDILETHIRRVEDRLGALNAYWSEQELPPCTCGVDISWEPRYCPYQSPTGCCGAEWMAEIPEEFWEEGTNHDDEVAEDDVVGEEVKHAMRREEDG